jgi:hypothetical protein
VKHTDRGYPGWKRPSGRRINRVEPRKSPDVATDA